MNQASHLINICSKWLYKMEEFYRQKDGTKKSEQKKRKEYFRPGTLPLGGREQHGFYLAEYLTSANLEISCCLFNGHISRRG